MIVVSLFDFTTNMVKPWAEAGHECYCVDMQHKPGIRKRGDVYVCGYDLRRTDSLGWPLPVDFPRPDILFAFPPCTDVAVSGARWMKTKGLGAAINALQMFLVPIELSRVWNCPYMIENPACTVSTYWREPDYKFNPCDYGDPYTKETWLWTGNGFVMPPIIQPGDMFDAPTIAQGPIDTKRIHHAAPGPERANFRSETPMGFARAVFHANHRRLVSVRPQDNALTE